MIQTEVQIKVIFQVVVSGQIQLDHSLASCNRKAESRILTSLILCGIYHVIV